MSKTTILVVDDEVHVKRVTAMWLARHGFTVLEASNGQQALDNIRSHPVDMLVTDVNMPVMDGITLVTAVRRELGLTMPIIMLSARCDQTMLAARVKELDVRLYPKPFVPSRLVQDVTSMLGSARCETDCE